MMIKVERLTYEYHETKALDNISFFIKAGTITALVGPNGAGKTTLLRCIAGLVKPYAGSISVDGINVLEEPRKSHELMGFLPDFFGLYDALTVRQSLEYFALAHNISPAVAKGRAVEVADLLNLTDKFDNKASSLSRGMRQRLAIGQAMVHYPKVLILDEPSAGLDPEARISLADLFIELNTKKNMTIIVSSHILAELDQYAKELLVLRNGNIIKNDLIACKDGEIRKIMIRCKSGKEKTEDVAKNCEFVSNITYENGYICLGFSGKDSDVSELLKILIDNEISVVEFFIKAEGVQEHYLKTIKTQR